MTGKAVVVLCEGEFDGLLVWQEAGDLVDVAALGSASTRPTPAHLIPLLGARHWLLAADCDIAGERAAKMWGEYTARVVRRRPLLGNDLTDFWRAGGDLRAWITDCLERLERRPAAGPSEAEALRAEDRRADPSGDRGCDPLVEFAVRELGAVCTTGWFEEQAEILLAQAEDSPAWRRRWAELAEAARWACWGTTWQEWAGEVCNDG